MEMQLKSHSFSKTILCRKRCHHCEKSIRFFGLRCRVCRMKCHKGCSDLTGHNCFPACERKSKSKFFRRSLTDRRCTYRLQPTNRAATKGQPAQRETAELKWKLGPRQTYTNTRQHHWSFSPIRNVHSPTGIPTSSGLTERSRTSLDAELYGFGETENYRNILHLSGTNQSGFGRGLTPHTTSVVSSGYSSVNQSCSSSAGTGSQRSRSPTPDQIETVKEEPSSERFGDRLLGYDVTRRHHEEKATLRERNTASCIEESPVFSVESEEDSSGEWDERENHESFKPRQGLQQRELRELEIKYSDLEIDEKVGVGPNGPVYRGRWYGNVMVHTRKTSKQKDVEEFRKEVALLSMIRHENVMLFMGACLEPPNLAVVTSLRKCLSIHNHLHCQESRFSMASRLNIMLQVAQGMSYLHAKCITVPCLRTMNIYLESKVKLCINGYTYLHHQVKRDGYSSVPHGHLTYLAPEVITKVNVDLSTGRIVDTTVRNRKMDVYAYGTVMYEILTDKWPFANLCPETVIWMIGKGLPQSLAKVKGPDTVKDLIKSCWALDPNQRPSFANITQILKHKNLSTNYISRRHSISEPENMHCVGKISDLCHLKRI